nr:MAG TPA: hypothetical protein [Caudoviricetes sp.]
MLFPRRRKRSELRSNYILPRLILGSSSFVKKKENIIGKEGE